MIIKGRIDNIFLLGIVLLLPLFFQLMKMLFEEKSTIFTVLTYLIVLLVIIIKKRKISISDLIILVVMYSFFGLNYLIFPETRYYFTHGEMTSVFVFFVPISVLLVRHIENWYLFDDVNYPLSLIAIVFGLIISINRVGHSIHYMEFSYAMLPFLIIIYLRIRKAKSLLSIIVFFIGLIEIISFGARAPIIILAFYIIAFEAIRTDTKRNTKLLVMTSILICSVIILFFSDFIVLKLSELSLFKNSYFLWNLQRGRLLEDSSRDAISLSCISRLRSMGIEVTGIFGDRRYCAGVYPHNIVFEILMSFGWIFGVPTLLFLFWIIIKPLLNKSTREVTLFLIAALFLRYFVSGSYIIEGKFWIFLFAIISIHRSNIYGGKQSDFIENNTTLPNVFYSARRVNRI